MLENRERMLEIVVACLENRQSWSHVLKIIVACLEIVVAYLKTVDACLANRAGLPKNRGRRGPSLVYLSS